jgi:hypothetical protein
VATTDWLQTLLMVTAHTRHPDLLLWTALLPAIVAAWGTVSPSEDGREGQDGTGWLRLLDWGAALLAHGARGAAPVPWACALLEALDAVPATDRPANLCAHTALAAGVLYVPARWGRVLRSHAHVDRVGVVDEQGPVAGLWRRTLAREVEAAAVRVATQLHALVGAAADTPSDHGRRASSTSTKGTGDADTCGYGTRCRCCCHNGADRCVPAALDRVAVGGRARAGP